MGLTKSLSKQTILFIGPIPYELGGIGSGGIETHCWQLATQSYNHGYNVFILTYGKSSFKKEKDGVNIISISQNKFTFPIKVLHAIRNWLKIENCNSHRFNFLKLKDKLIVHYCAQVINEIINFVKPDIIHIHLDGVYNRNILALFLLKKSCPIILTDHGIGVLFKYGTFEIFNLDRTYLLRMLKEELKIADRVISLCNFSKKYFCEFLDFPTEKTTVIHNPIDENSIPLFDKENLRLQLGIANNKRIVFFLGAWKSIEKKGLDILLHAFEANDYLRKTCALIIIANKDGLNMARDLAKYKTFDMVLLSPQPFEKAVKYYSIADVFVLPSRTEGIGIVYEEALVVGTPIVGWSESVRELEELLGIYVGEKFNSHQENEVNLAEKILKVLNADVDRKVIRKKAIENLSWNLKYNEFNNVYKELTCTWLNIFETDK